MQASNPCHAYDAKTGLQCKKPALYRIKQYKDFTNPPPDMMCCADHLEDYKGEVIPLTIKARAR